MMALRPKVMVYATSQDQPASLCRVEEDDSSVLRKPGTLLEVLPCKFGTARVIGALLLLRPLIKHLRRNQHRRRRVENGYFIRDGGDVTMWKRNQAPGMNSHQ